MSSTRRTRTLALPTLAVHAGEPAHDVDSPVVTPLYQSVNFVQEIGVKADRGIIKARRGEILVDSRPSFDVFITPAFCERCSEEVLPRLAGWLRLPAHEPLFLSVGQLGSLIAVALCALAWSRLRRGGPATARGA